MKIPLTRYSAWGALVLAITLWAGVGYFAWMITTAAEEHATRITAMEQEEVEGAAAIRLHALARDTKGARAALEGLSDSGIVEILDMIESLARETRIPIQIGQVPSISSPEGSIIHTATFTVEAQDSFTQVVQAIALLESFPIASSLDELRLERLPATDDKKARPWHLVAQMRFFTTADLSSL
ncbi:hypothetical protein HY414_01830 [Candidatus Kaiserbacteria bacterium]|nr:hypothetical protein [Candidatus Kaiserbacteria bacterium]